jgi:hypothetical protein
MLPGDSRPVNEKRGVPPPGRGTLAGPGAERRKAGAMTEDQWDNCTDPQEMLTFVHGRASDRKLRLLAVACMRQLPLPDERIDQIIRTSESYADGKAGWNDLSNARKQARLLAREVMRTGRVRAGFGAGFVEVAGTTAHPSPALAAQRLTRFYGGLPNTAPILRDLFGNPARTVTVDPALLAWNGG